MTTETPSFFQNMHKATGAAWQALPEQLAGSAMLGAAGAAVAGIGVAAHKIYDAATKTRDFRRMLAFDQDLAQQAKENPKLVNQAFTTLRTFNKPFSSDPMVASSYVKTLITNPQGAANTVGAALSASGNLPNAIGETFNRSAVTGLQFKDPQKLMQKDLAHQHAIMTMRRDVERDGATNHEFAVARARAEGQGLGNLTHARALSAEQARGQQADDVRWTDLLHTHDKAVAQGAGKLPYDQAVQKMRDRAMGIKHKLDMRQMSAQHDFARGEGVANRLQGEHLQGIKRRDMEALEYLKHYLRNEPNP